MDKENKLAIVNVVLQVVYFSLASDPFHPSNAVFVVTIGLALLADGTHGENKYGADPLNR